MGVTLITFARRYWLDASHRSLAQTKAQILGGRNCGAPPQSLPTIDPILCNLRCLPDNNDVCSELRSTSPEYGF